jgi:pimeloyl-ACP methyl ester carboxylesterase
MVTVMAPTHPQPQMANHIIFLNRYVRKVLAGIGHFPQREAPEQVASELLSFLV